MGLNVLIVDDSSLTRKKIRRIIEMTDMEVAQFTEAGNGVEALKILCSFAHISPLTLLASNCG